MPIPGRPSPFNPSVKFGGFTLIELVIIIVVLGIVAAVAIPKIGSVLENSRVSATTDEMNRLKRSIVGNPQAIAGGRYSDRGFEGDVGFPPAQLTDLVRRPDSIPAYNRITRRGWNGPYIDSSNQGYKYDAWDSLYRYSSTERTLVSTGADPDIVISF